MSRTSRKQPQGEQTLTFPSSPASFFSPPTPVVDSSADLRPYFIHAHNVDSTGFGGTPAVLTGKTTRNFFFSAAFGLDNKGGIQIGPGESKTIGPFSATRGSSFYEFSGGGSTDLEVTLSEARGFGGDRLLEYLGDSFPYINLGEADLYVAPPRNSSYAAEGCPQWLTVSILVVNAGAPGPIPADYHVNLIPPGSGESDSAHRCYRGESITLGPFAPDDIPDIHVPSPGLGFYVFCYTQLISEARGERSRQGEAEHTVVSELGGISAGLGLNEWKAYIPLDDPPSALFCKNLADSTIPTFSASPKTRGPVGLLADGVDGWAAQFNGVDTAIACDPGAFGFDECNDGDYSCSLWVNLDSIPYNDSASPIPYPPGGNYPGGPLDIAEALVSNSYLLNNLNTATRGFTIGVIGDRSGLLTGLTRRHIIAFGRHSSTGDVYTIEDQRRFDYSRYPRNESPSYLQINQWYHVVLTRSTVTGAKLWVNGELVGQDDSAGAKATDPGAPATSALTFGSQANDGLITNYDVSNLDGRMCGVQLIARELTEAEIKRLYEAGARYI